MNTRHLLSPVVASTLAASLALGALAPVTALAESGDLQSQVNEAQSRLNELYSEAEQRNYELEATVGELNDTIKKLDQTTADIEKTQEDLVVARKRLGTVIADTYKAGEISLLQLVLESNDLDDLVSRVVYANKVASYHADVVTEVNELEKSLKDQQVTYTKEKNHRQELVNEKQALKDETDQAVDEAEAYYNQLSDELKAQIEIEQAAAALAAQQANAEAAEQAAQEAEKETTSNTTAQSDESSNKSDDSSNTQSQTSNSSDNNDNNTSSDDDDDESSSSETVSTGTEAPATSVTPSATGSAAAMVSQAYQAIGSAYRWSGYVWTGDPSTSAFTCSGLIDFALGRPTNSSWPTSLYAEVESAGGMKSSIDALNYGDLVFTGNGGVGHVGIYVGGGQFLDSSYEGVSVRAVNPGTFIGGGSIF